jgi:hypothetical protein
VYMYYTEHSSRDILPLKFLVNQIQFFRRLEFEELNIRPSAQVALVL